MRRMDTPNAIVAECMKLGMRQAEIAEYTGLSPGYISRLARGLRGSEATQYAMMCLRAALRNARRRAARNAA